MDKYIDMPHWLKNGVIIIIYKNISVFFPINTCYSILPVREVWDEKEPMWMRHIEHRGNGWRHPGHDMAYKTNWQTK